MAIVVDGYILSRIGEYAKWEGSLEEVRHLYEVDDAVKVWID